LSKPCDWCAGRGYVPDDAAWKPVPCDRCNGTGRIEVAPSATVTAVPGFVVFSLGDGPTAFGALEESLRARDLPQSFLN
jgi:hypothetical protein